MKGNSPKRAVEGKSELHSDCPTLEFTQYSEVILRDVHGGEFIFTEAEWHSVRKEGNAMSMSGVTNVICHSKEKITFDFTTPNMVCISDKRKERVQLSTDEWEQLKRLFFM